jgi:hypothetical protein
MPEALQVIGEAEVRWAEAEDWRGLAPEDAAARAEALWSATPGGEGASRRRGWSAPATPSTCSVPCTPGRGRRSLERSRPSCRAVRVRAPDGEPVPTWPCPSGSTSGSEEARAGVAFWRGLGAARSARAHRAAGRGGGARLRRRALPAEARAGRAAGRGGRDDADTVLLRVEGAPPPAGPRRGGAGGDAVLRAGRRGTAGGRGAGRPAPPLATRVEGALPSAPW